MPRAAWTDSRNDCVTSVPVKTVEQGRLEAEFVLQYGWCKKAWVRDDDDKIVWRQEK